MDSKYKHLAVTCVVVIFSVVSFAQMGPPASSQGHKYDLEIQKVEPLNDTVFVVFQGLKVKRYNKTFYVADGSFSMSVDFDDEWEIEATCWRSKLGNNQWELTPLKAQRQPVSEFITNVYVESIQDDLVPYSDLPAFKNEDPKIFPKGLYTITNYVADVQKFPPFLQDGTYRIEIYMFLEKILQSGFIIYWKVYPEIG